MRTGRPPFKPDNGQRKMVSVLAAAGIRRKLIARALSIGVSTLEKCFPTELKNGLKDVLAEIEKGLYIKALQGDVTCMLFTLKCKAGWKEYDQAHRAQVDPPKLGISFEDGGPGRVRAEPFDMDSHIDVRPGADRLDDPEPAAEVKMPAGQEFIPRQLEAPKPTSLSQWEVLGLSAEEFARRNQPAVDAPFVHEHRALPDSPCARCRQMWVNGDSAPAAAPPPAAPIEDWGAQQAAKARAPRRF